MKCNCETVFISEAALRAEVTFMGNCKEVLRSTAGVLLCNNLLLSNKYRPSPYRIKSQQRHFVNPKYTELRSRTPCVMLEPYLPRDCA